MMNVPKLRFKDDDGRDFPGWDQIILGKIADPNIRWSLTGGPFGSNLKAEDYTDNGVRIIQLQNIGDGIFNDDYKIFTSANKADELLSCNIYPGEIIISKMGDPVARCCIMPSNQNRYLMASDGIRLVVDKSLFNTKYIHDFINSETFRKSALEASTGSTRRRIGLDELKKLPIIYPCLEEQTKIANFLTAVDEKISQLTQKCDLLKQYKKGVMQQIFSQKLRFKDDDGREFPEWETKKLGEISSSILYGMNASAITFDGENKYLRITDIDDDTRAFKPSPLSSPSGNIEAKFKMQIGDIVFARTGASVGKSYIYKPRDGNLFFAGFLIKFSISEGVPYFIFIQTLTERYRSWVKIMSMRSGQPGINAEEFKDFEISFPCKTEQTKIANFLTAIDDKITQAQTQLDAVKQYKKGLLQQLFV